MTPADIALLIIAGSVPLAVALIAVNTYQVAKMARARPEILPPIAALPAPAALAGDKPAANAKRAAVAKAMPRANGKFAPRSSRP